MPQHVVAGHLVIITAPVAALLALAYALRPAAREALRTPLVVAAPVNLGLVFWSSATGSQLYRTLQAAASPGAPTGAPAAEFARAYQHAKAADALAVASLALVVVVVALAFWRLSPRHAAAGRHPIAAGVLFVSALAVGWYTADTLVLGMESVWSHHELAGTTP